MKLFIELLLNACKLQPVAANSVAFKDSRSILDSTCRVEQVFCCFVTLTETLQSVCVFLSRNLISNHLQPCLGILSEASRRFVEAARCWQPALIVATEANIALFFPFHHLPLYLFICCFSFSSPVLPGLLMFLFVWILFLEFCS